MKVLEIPSRVSLTEAPEDEIPVAKMLAEICSKPKFEKCGDILKGTCTRPVIVASLAGLEVIDETVSRKLGFEISPEEDPVCGARLVAGIQAPEMIYTETLGPELTKLPEKNTGFGPFGFVGYGSCLQPEYFACMSGG